MSRSIAPTTRRNRATLLAVAGVFMGTLLIAGILRFSGWSPAAKAHGELLQPPADLRALTPLLADGQPYRWMPAARTWRIAVAPQPNCTDACIQLAGKLATVWALMGQDADRVQILWIGRPPAAIAHLPALRVLQPNADLIGRLPRVAPAVGEDARGAPVFVIDPNGFVILRYPPGADPGGLRTDVAKLLKLM